MILNLIFHFSKKNNSGVISWCLVNIDNPQSYLRTGVLHSGFTFWFHRSDCLHMHYDMYVIFVEGGESSILL